MKKQLYISWRAIALSILLCGGGLASAQNELASVKFPEVQSQPKPNRTVKIMLLKDALKALQGYYKVDIVFADQAVELVTIASSNVDYNKSIERNLSSILRESGLKFKKMKNGSYAILAKETYKKTSYVVVPEQVQARKILIPDQPVLSLPEKVVQAQARQISGTVNEDTGVGLPGVSVVIKGSNNGTITDQDGKFNINHADSVDLLVFSYVGYVSQQIRIGSKTVVNVTLKADQKALDEVVVVGYGSQKKITMTGSVATISSKVIEKIPPVGSTTNMLAGLIPGLVSKQRSGSPGRDAASLSIRGFGNALIIVDGVENSFNNIDQNEIESISVLKDASAAIYGARAGNGVILVTTRRGKTGKPTIKLNSSYSLQAITNYPKPMSAGQFAEVDRESKLHAGLPEAQQRFTQQQVNLYYAGTDPNYPNTDWHDVLVRPFAPMQQHNISVSGGSERIKYFGLLGYMDQGTFWKNNGGDFKRFNIRSNIDAKITDGLSMSMNFSNINEVRKFPARDQNGSDTYLWQDFWGTLPIYPSAFPDPTKLPFAGSDANGSAYITSNREISGFADNDAQNIVVGASLKYDVPFVKGLSTTLFVNYNQNYNDTKVMDKPVNFYLYDYDSDIYTLKGTWSPEASLRQQNNKSRTITNQFSFNYTRNFATQHTVSVLAMYESIDYSTSYIQAQRSHFLTPAIEYLFGGSVKDQFSNGSATEMGRKSYIGRLNYSFKTKYLFEATFRADASARFPTDKRWGYFPSASAGWILSEESFIKDNHNWLDNLKLRGGISNTGYDNVGNFAYLAGYQFGTSYLFGSQITSGLRSTGLANPLLTWEKMSTYSMGLDFAMFRSKVYGELDVFKRNRRGIPASRILSLPTTFGAALPPENLNSSNDRGFEAMLGVRDRKGDFSWDISGNISWSAAKWNHYEEPDYSSDPQRAAIYQVSGQWADRVVGYRTDGLYTSQEEINAMPFVQDQQANKTVKPGDIKYIDQNKDGILDWKDQVDIGRGDLPHYMLGLSTRLQYKNFDLSALFQGAAGNYINIRLPGSTQMFSERWTEANNNPNAIVPRTGSVAQGGGLSDFYLKKAGYIRLKTLNFGYNLPKALLRKAGVENLYIYFAGFNLVTLNKLKKYGYDPEARSSTGGLDGSSYYYYPQQRTLTFGLSLTL